MDNFLLSLHQVGPVFLIILVGVLLKRFKLISDEFSPTVTAVVFRVGLPCLLFGTLMKTDFLKVFDPLPVLIALGGTLVFFGLGWLTGSLMIRDHRPRGAFILGSYWSNCAIIGFAIVQNVLGEKGMVPTAFIVAFLVPLFNILAVTTLTVIDEKNRPFPVRKVLLMLATHPLIIAITIGLVFSLLRVRLPAIVAKPIDLLGQMTLPLALLAIGATLSFSNIRDNFRNSLVASLFKTVLMPAGITLLAVLLGVRGDSLAALFIMTGTPAAITSFIVATAMKSDGKLAANIVMVSTLLSILTLATGIFILRELRLM